MNNSAYRRERYEKLKNDPIAHEARKKKRREREQRQRYLDKLQRCKAFMEENGFTVEMK